MSKKKQAKKVKLGVCDEQVTRNYRLFMAVADGVSLRKAVVPLDLSPARGDQIFRSVKKQIEKNIDTPPDRSGLTAVSAVRGNVDDWLAFARLSYYQKTGKQLKEEKQ